MPTTAHRVAASARARERLLAAADELFYEEGVHTVGIDRVIERAGVAKASLYNTFGSKDELIRAYLAEPPRGAPRRGSWAAGPATTTPRERLLGVFDASGESFAEPGFRGCAFVNASAESAPGSSVEAGRASSAAAGCAACSPTWPARPARAIRPRWPQQLVLLYDGASVSAPMDRNLRRIPDRAGHRRGAGRHGGL